MSYHSLDYLASNVLVGMGRKAWHHREDNADSLANHFDGPIPVSVVNERLFAWDAVKVPLMAQMPNGDLVEVPGREGIAHSETGRVFGIGSDRYAIHQFRDSLTAGLVRIVGDGLVIESAGLLKWGAIGWVSVSLADTVTTAEGVEFLPHLLAYGSHDQSLPTGYKRTATLVVCDNTMGSAMRENNSGSGSGEYRIRHTRNSLVRLEDAQHALSLIAQTEDEFTSQVKALCETFISRKTWDDFLTEYVPMPEEEGRGRTMAENKRETLGALYKNDPRVAPWQDTAFGVVQAVNTWDHHYSIVRGATRGERNSERSLGDYYDSLDTVTLNTLNKVLASA